jgi:hypothetical protein
MFHLFVFVAYLHLVESRTNLSEDLLGFELLSARLIVVTASMNITVKRPSKL